MYSILDVNNCEKSVEKGDVQILKTVNLNMFCLMKKLLDIL